MEFVALPLCPPALDRSLRPADVRAPVPCPAAPLRPGYVQMVPLAAVYRNSRVVPIALLLPSPPLVTGLLGSYRHQVMYQFDTQPRIARPNAFSAYRSLWDRGIQTPLLGSHRT